MRRKIIAANWKMNIGTPKEAYQLASQVSSKVGELDDRDIVLCPPSTALIDVVKAVGGTFVCAGGQNIYPEESGAFTGEISPAFLLGIGCKYVIVGHSERRQYFQESNEFINKKVRVSMDVGLTPILCVGETLEQREAGTTENVIRTHVTEGLKDIPKTEIKKLVLAYEPIWAIGTGKTAKPEDAEAVHQFIRGVLAEIYDQEAAEQVRIQYGGSVKPENANALLTMPNIDGALVGGASLKAAPFAEIVRYENA